MNDPLDRYFYLSQRNWILDDAPLKIVVKSRQSGFSYCNTYRLVRLVSAADARLDAYISSRDQHQARLQLEDSLHWANLLRLGASSLGEILFDRDSNLSAFALQFANGRRIYSLSSNPNALAGKRGHVTLDEFALHQDQRLLYRVAKPVTTWGGQLSIISTHRGFNTVFNEIIRSITEAGNPMGWSLHQVPIQKAVDEGIVERINQKTGRHESRPAFLQRLRAECIDEEQWLQEYCCLPADENAAFFSYDLLAACEDPSLQLLSLDQFCSHAQAASPPTSFFLGLDVARRRNLCVFDVGEKIGNLTFDRLRLELHDQPFPQIRAVLYRLLPLVKRACLDATGLGMQLAEEARLQFGSKVEPVTFSPATKEQLAFALRRDFEDGLLRIPHDDLLRADLRGLKKEITPSGNLRFLGDTADSHCDRTWAKALRQFAARRRPSAGALVV